MSARYRIEVCQCGWFGRRHCVLIDPDGHGVVFYSIAEALAHVAKVEAHRLAGIDWALWEDGRYVCAQRQGSTHAAKFHSWGEVARFLAALANAGRAPLVVAS